MNLKKKSLVASVIFALTFIGYRATDAWLSRSTPDKVAAGQALFEKNWEMYDSACGQGDGLGPVFNAKSCVACHSQGGLGGSSGNEFNVLSFEVLPDRARDRDEVVSSVVHLNSVTPGLMETREGLDDLYPRIQASLRSARESIFPFFDSGRNYGGGGCDSSMSVPSQGPIVSQSLAAPIAGVQVSPVIFHELNSPALFGAGLIDEISSVSISVHGAKRTASKLSSELSGEFDSNGIGTTRVVNGAVGRFGWKGQFASLEGFVASACAMELGLTNHLHSQPVPGEHRADHQARNDMTRQQLNELVCFVRSLPRPEQVLPVDRKARVRVEYGERIFSEIGCADCHVPDLGEVKGIYTDFHLYNLEDLERPTSGYVHEEVEPEFQVPSWHPQPDQWQTPPLWGVADSAPYFHDGGSPTLSDAITRHKGQAVHSGKRFKELSRHDKAMLIEFLQTLRAPGMGVDQAAEISDSSREFDANKSKSPTAFHRTN